MAAHSAGKALAASGTPPTSEPTLAGTKNNKNPPEALRSDGRLPAFCRVGGASWRTQSAPCLVLPSSSTTPGGPPGETSFFIIFAFVRITFLSASTGPLMLQAVGKLL